MYGSSISLIPLATSITGFPVVMAATTGNPAWGIFAIVVAGGALLAGGGLLLARLLGRGRRTDATTI